MIDVCGGLGEGVEDKVIADLTAIAAHVICDDVRDVNDDVIDA